MTRRDNQPKYYDCARHKSLQSSHPPRHKCLILFVARFSPRLSLYTIVRLLTTGIILALIAGVAIKIKLFGGQ